MPSVRTRVVLGVTDPSLLQHRVRPRKPRPRLRDGWCYRCGVKVRLFRNGRPRKHDCLLVPMPMDEAENAWAEELRRSED